MKALDRFFSQLKRPLLGNLLAIFSSATTLKVSPLRMPEVPMFRRK